MFTERTVTTKLLQPGPSGNYRYTLAWTSTCEGGNPVKSLVRKQKVSTEAVTQKANKFRPPIMFDNYFLIQGTPSQIVDYKKSHYLFEEALQPPQNAASKYMPGWPDWGPARHPSYYEQCVYICVLAATDSRWWCQSGLGKNQPPVLRFIVTNEYLHSTFMVCQRVMAGVWRTDPFWSLSCQYGLGLPTTHLYRWVYTYTP